LNEWFNGSRCRYMMTGVVFSASAEKGAIESYSNHSIIGSHRRPGTRGNSWKKESNGHHLFLPSLVSNQEQLLVVVVTNFSTVVTRDGDFFGGWGSGGRQRDKKVSLWICSTGVTSANYDAPLTTLLLLVLAARARLLHCGDRFLVASSDDGSASPRIIRWKMSSIGNRGENGTALH